MNFIVRGEVLTMKGVLDFVSFVFRTKEKAIEVAKKILEAVK